MGYKICDHKISNKLIILSLLNFYEIHIIHSKRDYTFRTLLVILSNLTLYPYSPII